MSAEDHVVVSREFFDKTGPIGYQERNVLNMDVPEDLTPTCATWLSLAALPSFTARLSRIPRLPSAAHRVLAPPSRTFPLPARASPRALR